MNEEKEKLALESKDLRELFFKMVRMYFKAKEQIGDMKWEKLPTSKIMGTTLNNMFLLWNEKEQKNKIFKLKDDQREWTMIIDSIPPNILKHCQSNCYWD